MPLRGSQRGPQSCSASGCRSPAKAPSALARPWDESSLPACGLRARPHGDVPRQQPPLHEARQPEKQHADERQHQNGGELARDLEIGSRHHDEVTEAGISSHELGHHGADHGQNGRHLHACEHARQRVRQAEPPEGLHRRSAHRARQMQHLRRGRAKAHHRADHDGKERHQRHDHDLGCEAEAEPREQQRRDGHLRDRLRAHDQRIDGLIERARIGHADRERQPDQHADGETEHDLERGDPGIREQDVPAAHHVGEDGARWRQQISGDREQIRGELPQRDEPDEREGGIRWRIAAAGDGERL